LQFPIIFRPRRTGYFYEKVYLMTHPRLSNEDDKIFNLRLAGICMEPDCPLPHSKSTMVCHDITQPYFTFHYAFINSLKIKSDFEFQMGKKVLASVEQVSRQFKSKMLYQEGMDILNSILDNVLYDKKAPKSTLPFG
jgi:hypothetical protein